MKVSSAGFRRLIRGLRDQKIYNDGYVGIFSWISATDIRYKFYALVFEVVNLLPPRRLELCVPDGLFDER